MLCYHLSIYSSILSISALLWCAAVLCSAFVIVVYSSPFQTNIHHIFHMINERSVYSIYVTTPNHTLCIAYNIRLRDAIVECEKLYIFYFCNLCAVTIHRHTYTKIYTHICKKNIEIETHIYKIRTYEHRFTYTLHRHIHIIHNIQRQRI